ncbi:MAG: hypothetical protein WBO10_14780 [Pyrinomonadaceae bacterium]
MKRYSRKRALTKLEEIRNDLAEAVRRDFEHKAASCLTCTTPGACCLDAHFVNVHISRLESEAIKNALACLPQDLRERVETRIDASIRDHALTAVGDTFDQKYACPLYEKGVGCLVHHTAKPLPCITHACYESKSDMPPDSLLAEHELRVDRLNEMTYGREHRWLPIPLAIARRADDESLPAK